MNDCDFWGVEVGLGGAQEIGAEFRGPMRYGKRYDGNAKGENVVTNSCAFSDSAQGNTEPQKNKLFKHHAASIRRPFAGFSGLWRRHIMRFGLNRYRGRGKTETLIACIESSPQP